MLSKRVVFALVSLFIWPVCAAGIPPLPDVGSGIDQVDQTLFKCQADGSETRCARPGTALDLVAGERVIEVVLFYRAGKLFRSVLVLDERRYDHIVAGLSHQLGAGEQAREGLKAGMGGIFDNRQQIWRRDGHVWMLEQYFERIIHSGLCVTNEAQFETLMAERERMRFRGARDL